MSGSYTAALTIAEINPRSITYLASYLQKLVQMC